MFNFFSSPELRRAKQVLRIMGDVFYSYNLYSDKVSIAGRYQFPLRLGGRPFLAGDFLKVPIDTALLPKAVFRDQLMDERLLTALRSATGCNVEVVCGDRLILPSIFGEKPKSMFSKGRPSFLFGSSDSPPTFDLWYIVELDINKLRGIPRFVPFSSIPSPDPSHIISFPLGHTIGEGVRLVDFPSDMISLIVAGATGQGKSSYLRSVVQYVSSHYPPSYVKFYLADFKPARVDFKVFNGPSFIHIDNPSDLVTIIEAENNVRASLLNSSSSLDIFQYNRSASSPLPYIFVVIDEFASYRLMLSSLFSKKDSDELFNRLMVLVSVTRSCGIYFVLGTQRPSVDVVPGQLKANLIARIAFSMVTSTDANVIFDSEDLSEFPVQIGCKGRGFALYGDSFVEFQSPFYC